jgi:hypothetical protein
MSKEKREQTKAARIARLRQANAARRAAGLPNGRPRGSPNKLTTLMHEGLQYVYNELGGHDAFAAWARKHPSQLYALLPKSILREREANAVGTDATVIINDGSRPVFEERQAIDFVAPERSDGEGH